MIFRVTDNSDAVLTVEKKWLFNKNAAEKKKKNKKYVNRE